jgi:ATP-dependent RNA helicase RhlE
LNAFENFGIAEQILRAVAGENYTTPTPIQSQGIPVVLAGRDLMGIAQTGTGKTAAFALPLLDRLARAPRALEKKTCRVLVLSPTRELSGQILDSFRTYGKHLRLRSTLAIGGVSMGKQVRALMDGVDVLVATPGRLLDLIRGNALRLNRVEAFVLDEADRMLDMGFIGDIRQIIAKLPAQRQTLLFSATMPKEIADLAASMLRDPARVEVTPAAKTADRIAQRVIHTDRGCKQALLAELLRSEPIDRALVFTRTKHGADKVVRGLVQAGIAAEAIHGNKSQGQRERVLANFRSGVVRTLIATDIAARGIDVDGISHVINYDLPNVAESYVHRIGRTARAGAEGIAISFCDGEEAAYLRDIERLIRMTIPATGEREAERRPSTPQRNARPQQRNRKPQGRGPAAAGGDHRGPKPSGGDHRGPKPSGKRQDRPRRGFGAQRPSHGQRENAGSMGELGFMRATERAGS